MHCQCNCAIIQLGVNYVAPPLKNSEIPSECSASNFCLVLHWWCRFQEIIYILGIFSKFNCKNKLCLAKHWRLSRSGHAHLQCIPRSLTVILFSNVFLTPIYQPDLLCKDSPITTIGPKHAFKCLFSNFCRILFDNSLVTLPSPALAGLKDLNMM